MIITKIIGGLGNQMFQYAAGKRLAMQHNTILKLDLSGFDEYKPWNAALDAFNTEYRLAGKEEIIHYTSRHLLDKIRDRIVPFKYRRFYRERSFRYDKYFSKYPDNIYLKGYWQSEKYFKSIESIIRKDFTIKEEFVRDIQTLAEKIKIQNSISIHIRKGDYANPEVYKIHGILSGKYYNHAIDLVKSKIINPVFYIYSDDEAWASSLLSVNNAVFVSGKLTHTHYEDFYLMSICKHNIIANSSFSWWAAWLNNNPDKIVIAPKKWFNKGPKDTQDLLPDGWIKI